MNKITNIMPLINPSLEIIITGYEKGSETERHERKTRKEIIGEWKW